VEPARKLVRKLSAATGGTRLSVRQFHEEAATIETLRHGLVEPWESDMMSEMQIHTIARQMMEKHGLTAIAQAAHNALACESKGDADEAREWRHIEDAMKLMRGPHQS
jgi:N-acetyl-anhydromuramyl-L-alanine amidase AmpD